MWHFLLFSYIIEILLDNKPMGLYMGGGGLFSELYGMLPARSKACKAQESTKSISQDFIVLDNN